MKLSNLEALGHAGTNFFFLTFEMELVPPSFLTLLPSFGRGVKVT